MEKAALVVAVAVERWKKSCVDGQLDVPVDTDRREVLTAGGRQRHYGRVAGERTGGRPVQLAVQVEAELAPVKVEQDSDHAACREAAVRACRVYAGVHEPAARVVDVHAPAFTVTACTQTTSIPQSHSNGSSPYLIHSSIAVYQFF